MTREQAYPEISCIKRPPNSSPRDANFAPPITEFSLSSLPSNVLLRIIWYLNPLKVKPDHEKWRTNSRKSSRFNLHSHFTMDIINRGEAAALLWSYALPHQKTFVGFSDSHSLQCMMRCSLILLQDSRINAFRIPRETCEHLHHGSALAPSDSCLNCSCFNEELCEIATYSRLSCPIRRLSLGNLEVFSPEQISSVIIPFIRSIRATVEQISLNYPSKATCHVFAGAAIGFPRLQSLSVHCEDLRYTLYEDGFRIFLESILCSREASPMTSKLSLIFSGQVPASEAFFGVPETFKELTLICNSLDPYVLSTFLHLEQIEWTSQPFNFSDLIYLKPRVGSKLRSLSFQDIEPLFPKEISLPRYKHLFHLIKRLHVKNEIPLTRAGVDFLSRVAPSLEVLQVSIPTSLVPLLSTYIEELKHLKVLDLDILASDLPEVRDGFLKHLYETCNNIWHGLLGCPSSLEHLRIPKGCIGRQMFFEVLKKFKMSLQAFQVPLLDDGLEHEGIFFEACWKDIKDALGRVPIVCPRLKQLCVLKLSGLEGIREGAGEEEGNECDKEMFRNLDQLDVALTGFDKDSFFYGLKAFQTPSSVLRRDNF